MIRSTNHKSDNHNNDNNSSKRWMDVWSDVLDVLSWTTKPEHRFTVYTINNVIIIIYTGYKEI